MKKHTILKTLITISLCASSSIYACTTIIVGKKASENNSIIISRNSDSTSAVNAKHLVIHGVSLNQGNRIFKSSDNEFSYKLPELTYRYIGLPYWYANDKSMEQEGSNQYSVAISATESIGNNEKILKIDPYNKKSGLSEDSITSIVLSTARTAKEGIKIIGDIIEKQGAAQGFGIAIADTDEVWYLETATGHLWAAARVPDDSYFVSANQSRLSNINLSDTDNYLGSKNLITFARDHEFFTGNDTDFSLRKVYGEDSKRDIEYNYLRVWTLQDLYSPNQSFSKLHNNSPTFLKPEHKLNFNDVKTGLTNHYQGTKNNPYINNNEKEPYRPISVFRESNSHITILRDNLPEDIKNIVYISLGMNYLSIYLPFYSSINEVPEAYKYGTNESSDNSAYWTFRKVQALAMLDLKHILLLY